jgi:hypothetical protein
MRCKIYASLILTNNKHPTLETQAMGEDSQAGRMVKKKRGWFSLVFVQSKDHCLV